MLFNLASGDLCNLREQKVRKQPLSLLDSPSEVIKEILICRMEIMTEDYAEAVTQVLRENWPTPSLYQQDILSRIDQYNEIFYREIGKKNKLKELNPFYVQSEMYNIYVNRYQKHIAETVDEQANRTSLLSLFVSNTIVLAKGGGWKHKTSDTVSQLSRFSTSMVLPRTYFISPDNFDFDRKLELFENWKMFLSKWEATLL
ncbi:MAG: hypothetical protein ABW007_13540 [Chitinophagaceae bacterium]